jgi:hypothetical protein
MERFAFGQADVSDSEDEKVHEIREVNTLKNDIYQTPVESIRPLLEFLKCSICQDTACDPRVIKHCLHFFCKDCIEPYLLRL